MARVEVDGSGVELLDKATREAESMIEGARQYSKDLQKTVQIEANRRAKEFEDTKKLEISELEEKHQEMDPELEKKLQASQQEQLTVDEQFTRGKAKVEEMLLFHVTAVELTVSDALKEFGKKSNF